MTKLPSMPIDTKHILCITELNELIQKEIRLILDYVASMPIDTKHILCITELNELIQKKFV